MTPTNRVVTAVGYVRISVDRDEETSTTTQEASIRAYCAAQGWQVVDVVVEAGRSAFGASRSTRPGLTKARQMIDAGAANALVVWKLDRACRNAEDTLCLVRELKEVGARFVSVTEHFDSISAGGKMMVTMLSGLAEMESATKSERATTWHGHRRSVGSTPTGRRPFGYRRERNKLIEDKAEGDVIRRAAARVLAGDSLRSIVADLGGVKGTSGAPLNRRTLRQVLLSPTIAAAREVETGERTSFVRSDAWDPILEFETWCEVRAILTDPSRRTDSGNQRRWLLSGIAKCGNPACDGSKMGVKAHHSGRSRYVCRECHMSIEVERTDESVVHDLFALLDVPTWERLRHGRPVVVDTGYDEARDALYERHRTGFIDEDELAAGLKLVRQERDAAASLPTPTLPDVADLSKAWPKLKLEQRRLVLSTATESLTITPSTGAHGFDESRIRWSPVD